MDISLSLEDIKEIEKLKIMTNLTLVKEKIRLYEKKYECSFDDFERSVKHSQEDFGKWDDYIEWKAYLETVSDLNQKIVAIDSAQNIKLVEN